MTHRVQIAIVEYKINELLSKKRMIDQRLVELWGWHEELIEELYDLETPLQCSNCTNHNEDDLK